MKIELVGLSEDNMKQCFDLKVASEQMQYIASNFIFLGNSKGK